MKCEVEGCKSLALPSYDSCHGCLTHPDSPNTNYKYIDLMEELKKQLEGKTISKVGITYPRMMITFTDGLELGLTIDPRAHPQDLFTGYDEY
jgi:hypothetical protein